MIFIPTLKGIIKGIPEYAFSVCDVFSLANLLFFFEFQEDLETFMKFP